MNILSVRNLNKKFKNFALKNVSFALENGYIMGFIGRNGAGKTTTLKTMLNIVRADSGEVTVFGRDFLRNELASKQKIAFTLGGLSYYPQKKLKTITNVVKRFYDEWDDAVYQNYLQKFELDANQRVYELSGGMRVKYELALALSHNAQLLILDEPTSGLDPVSRDEMLELFQELIEDGERSILFSTHITADLEKCADFITYIKNGAIVASTEKDRFVGSYQIVKGTDAQLTKELRPKLIGCRKSSFGFSALIQREDLSVCKNLEVAPADIESIMIYFEKGSKE